MDLKYVDKDLVNKFVDFTNAKNELRELIAERMLVILTTGPDFYMDFDADESEYESGYRIERVYTSSEPNKYNYLLFATELDDRNKREDFTADELPVGFLIYILDKMEERFQQWKNEI